jgi:kynurenine formamidase
MLPDHRDDYLDGFYPQTASQLDGLRHFRHPVHGFYNGVEDRLVAAGSPHLGINRWAEAGIVGRGVVVDVAAHLHQQGAAPAHEDGAPIPISAVADAARAQGVTFAPGDILLLRTGWLGFYLGLNDAGQARIRELGTSSGLVQSHETLEWLWDRRIALLAADNVAVEVLPAVPDSPFVTAEEAAGGPRSRHTGLMHRAMIPLLGMALGELWDLDALAKDCAATGTWDCLVVAKPLHLIGGVGSPANAVAIK